MKLRYIGRQGFCRYYWRIYNEFKVMYAKVDGGILQPVAGGPIESIAQDERKRR